MDSIKLFQLSNGVIEVVLSNLGCTIVSIHAPDKNGIKKNIVAGYSDIEEYHKNDHYFGCTVGRFANRIAGGKFQIGDKSYELECNNPPNHLHGGKNGFNKQIWQAEATGDTVKMNYLSVDGEEGYPGNMDVTIQFSLSKENELIIAYSARTDKPTIVNLTNHTYFNLSGFEESKIYDHKLHVNADFYTPKNSENIPSGEVLSVAETPCDFRKPIPLGKNIDLLKEDMGYDMNFVLKDGFDTPCAELTHEISGRAVKVFTTKPGLQVYTANWWDGSIKGPQNVFYEKHGAVALETQSFPNSPNYRHFPNTILKPGETYRNTTVYQFT